MIPSDERVYFFMHIMKTAGTSFARHLEPNFPPEAIYPHPASTRHRDEYWKVAEIEALPQERRDEIRLYHGHFPFVIGQQVGAAETIVILRDPVERTISHLRHCERHFERHHGKPLEAIYDDDWHHPTLFRNYQVKQFAFTVADAPRAHIDIVEVDEARFRTAVDHLERVAVLGLTERYPEFLDAVAERYGWTMQRPLRLQASPGEVEVPPGLRRRIEADSAADIAFYEHARQAYERRSRRTAS